VARTPALPPPPPDFVAEDDQRERAAPRRSQFEVAYNAKGGPGYAEDDGQEQRHATAETSSPPLTQFDSTQPPTPVDSEIRCVDVAQRRPPESELERELLSALGAEGANRERETSATPDVVPVTPRKRALR
jgi:hypothetical protein